MLNLLSGLDTGCFNVNYSASREAFVKAVAGLPQELVIRHEQYTHPLTGPQDEALVSDVVFLGQQESPARLLVLISATHGVEGFAGSAIQVDCLAQLPQVLQAHPELGVVMIHAFNPWGFAWLRRADHEGIDLNRNFVDFSKPLPHNTGYEVLQPVFRDSKWLKKKDISELWSNTSFEKFLEQATCGQYDDRDGLFYGGAQPSWSRQMLEEITAKYFIAGAETIAVIDLHTGLGPYGYGEVINDHQPKSRGFAWAQRIYGRNAQSAFLGESFSAPKLGLVDYHWHEVIEGRGCFVTLEFGTYSAVQLISVLLREQIYHNLHKTDQLRDLSATQVMEMKAFFYPQETSWQQQVIFRARQIVSLALTGICA